MRSDCPPDSALRSFSVGQLDVTEVERIAGHIADCARCDQKLAMLDSQSDPLLAELRETATAPWVEVTGPWRDEHSQDEIALDHGRRLARQLAQGECRLGRFELKAELGEGTFGHVFEARDTELDRTVAVKVQRAGVLASDAEVRRFLHEAKSAAQLSHPGIVALHDCEQTEEGVCYLVTQFVDGQTLESLLLRTRFDPRDAARLCAELAETIQYAHEQGVVHRDIKPSNVIIDGEGRPHITDFGLAKRLYAESPATSEGRLLGTPAYMSPEQASGDSGQVDERSDIYSLGVVLYELLTGDRPFQGNHRQLVRQVIEDEPRPPRRLNDRVPRDLETICLKAIAKSPARRYATARALADDLRRFLDGEPILARPVGPGERLARWCRRYPLAAGLLVAVTAGSIAGFWYLSRLSRHFVEASGLDSARMEADMLERFNGFYSEKVIDRLDQTKVRVSNNYAERNDTVPLPATMLIDAGEHISKSHTGMEVRLYSNFPFRMQGGPRDAFEQRALDALQKNVKADAKRGGAEPSAYHEFGEKEGKPVVRYARAQIMQESCVKCHNQNTASPKRDWKAGDLVGVLAITRPLDRDIARTQSGLRGAFLVVAGVTAVLLGFSMAFVLATRARRRA
jgi:hypothetical protein